MEEVKRRRKKSKYNKLLREGVADSHPNNYVESVSYIIVYFYDMILL